MRAHLEAQPAEERQCVKSEISLMMRLEENHVLNTLTI